MSGKGDNAGVIAPPPWIALGAFVIANVLDRFVPLGYLAKTDPWLRIPLGAMAAAACALIFFLALRAFRRAPTNIPPSMPALALVTDGIYGYCRNPMYIALGLLLLAIGLLRPSDWMFPALVLFGLLIHYGVVLREEKYLRAKFGQAYEDYMKRVPRYVPGT